MSGVFSRRALLETLFLVGVHACAKAAPSSLRDRPIDAIPINPGQGNTSFFSVHPELIAVARNSLRKLGECLSVVHQRNLLNPLFDNGLLLVDVPYCGRSRPQGLEAYPRGPFFSSVEGCTVIEGSPPSFTGGARIQVQARVAHKPYSFLFTLAHEFTHLVSGRLNSISRIDFSVTPIHGAINYCFPGTFYGQSNFEENRAELVAMALVFPSARAILEEMDIRLGCRPAVSAARNDMFNRIREGYFGGNSPLEESPSVKRWLSVRLCFMRGDKPECLSRAREILFSHPDDIDGAKSILGEIHECSSNAPYRSSQDVTDVFGNDIRIRDDNLEDPIYLGGLTLLDNIINATRANRQVFPLEIRLYAIWYKALILSYPQDEGVIGRSTFKIYSESQLARARGMLDELSRMIGGRDHPLSGDIGLMRELMAYWLANKPYFNSAGGLIIPSPGFSSSSH